MSPNGCATKNRSKKWCAFESIVRHGIIDSLNPHVLAIYLEFVPVRGAVLERFKVCQCEDDNVHLHCRTWVPGDGHYRWL
jgi:hypothetical protein